MNARPRVPGFAGLVLAVLLSGSACSPIVQTEIRRLGHGYSTDTTTIQVVSTNVQGKNVYIPSTIVVTAGVPYTLSLYNTTDTPHGFAIAELGIEVVLLPKQEHAIALPALAGGKVHGIRCHLHPPHRTATLVVLPAD